jgi:hypothetical protein
VFASEFTTQNIAEPEDVLQAMPVEQSSDSWVPQRNLPGGRGLRGLGVFAVQNTPVSHCALPSLDLPPRDGIGVIEPTRAASVHIEVT